MALINCPECGKEISDKAAMCIHCGCPIASEQTLTANRNIPFKPSLVSAVKAKPTTQNKKRILIAVISVLAFIALSFVAVRIITEIKEEKAYQAQLEDKRREREERKEAERQAYEDLIEESKENIAPYLKYIGEDIPEGETIKIPSDLRDNLDNVEFMGLRGEIQYGKSRNGSVVKYCSWTSVEGFSEEEFQEFSTKLTDYFGSDPEIDSRDYSKGHTYRYFWVDSDNGLCVSFGHNLFSYSPDGSIEIMWSYMYCEGLDFYGL